ncbi:hypothetical protein DBR32_02140 [Taibaiella sp. KBW10]|nr:hypothetical protein DBR32_02140 [Taibaiella sp. KBW10]
MKSTPAKNIKVIRKDKASPIFSGLAWDIPKNMDGNFKNRINGMVNIKCMKNIIRLIFAVRFDKKKYPIVTRSSVMIIVDFPRK